MPIIREGSKADYHVDEEFYLSTKIQSSFFRGQVQEKIKNWMLNRPDREFKTMGGLEVIKLKPNLSVFQKVNLEKIITGRKSSRAFNGRSISFSQLCNLLTLTCSLKCPSPAEKRIIPSAGGLYPLETYILALNIKGLKKGLYHFNVLKNHLALLRKDKRTFELSDFWEQYSLYGEPAAIIYTTAVFGRTRKKYGARALKFIFFEAGAMASHMEFLAKVMDFGSCQDGGGFENRVEALIGVDGQKEGLVSSLIIGHG